VARANRAFLGRAVRYLASTGVRQTLDIGSGIPTVGNVHEIVQRTAPEARVVYVDIDPVAVAESLDLLADNPRATAIRGDVRGPREILEHPAVRGMLDLTQPVGLVLAAVLHFVPEDVLAYGAVDQLLAAVGTGSYLIVSHAATESFARPTPGICGRQTATPRDRAHPVRGGAVLHRPAARGSGRGVGTRVAARRGRSGRAGRRPVRRRAVGRGRPEALAAKPVGAATRQPYQPRVPDLSRRVTGRTRSSSWPGLICQGTRRCCGALSG
jgi:hypothetical protein